MERITANISENTFLKEQARRNRVSEQRLSQQDAEFRRMEEKIRKFGDRIDIENKDLKQALEGLVAEDIDDVDDDDDNDP